MRLLPTHYTIQYCNSVKTKEVTHDCKGGYRHNKGQVEPHEPSAKEGYFMLLLDFP